MKSAERRAGRSACPGMGHAVVPERDHPLGDFAELGPFGRVSADFRDRVGERRANPIKNPANTGG